MSDNKSCLCCSGLNYEDCCGQFHSLKQIPKTAEQLMRSRYAAFAMSNAQYLNDTSLLKQDNKGLEEWSKSNHWQKLEILSKSKGNELDKQGFVEFKAYYIDEFKKEVIHHELSDFIKIEGKWYYDKGKVSFETPNKQQVLIGRNDPCLCGSGKKYKKCCG